MVRCQLASLSAKQDEQEHGRDAGIAEKTLDSRQHERKSGTAPRLARAGAALRFVLYLPVSIYGRLNEKTTDFDR